MVYWITGRKGSGKTTLAKKIVAQLPKGVLVDADHFRGLVDFGYSDEGRRKNQECLAAFACMLEHQGFTPVVACVSPNKALRKLLQASFKQCVEIQLYHGTLWEGTTYEE